MNNTCDILVPTYNRKKFEKLINHNINIQTYPFIKNIIIADDGTDDKLLIDTKKYNVLYYKVERMTIGEKRNFLLDKTVSRYACFMDTDDMYNPNYITTSIYNLINSYKSISGSSDMQMLSISNGKYYRSNCMFIHALNEATIVIDTLKTNFRFDDSMTGEGLVSLSKYIKEIYCTDIVDIMCCVSHDSNTVPKNHIVNDKHEIKSPAGYSDHLEIVSGII